MIPYWLNPLVGTLVVGAEILLVGVVGIWFLRTRFGWARSVVMFLASRGVVLIGVLGLLAWGVAWYYEFAGFAACVLCWLARVFIFPMPILVGVALARGETDLLPPYLLSLALPGLVVTGYQHLLQMGVVGGEGSEGTVCAALGGPDCAARWFFEWGHVTFPWAGFVLFAWVAVLATLAWHHGRTPRV